ncbi:Exocyst complex component exo84a [Turnera subulata]|uniref:Exocyst complex component exo84a n=1 Tax=Turnera subulata TaxID=218843 RepID=A0A9Q0FI29_9ROSI|nr:Exocyst complex component exo84a [Turnera subulata]
MSLGSIGDSSELEGTHQSLSDRLKVFKSSQFDPESYLTSKCMHMNEKEIKHVCSLLLDLKKASAEEMRISVYANYSAFIRTSREISYLEAQLLSMRNLLSTQATLVQGLAERAKLESLWAGTEDSAQEELLHTESKELSRADDWLIEYLDTLEVLLAERRVDETMAALERGENLIEEAYQNQNMSPSSLSTLQSAVREQKQNLAEQLADTIGQPSTRGLVLRSAVSALKALGDGPRAHTLLLNSHKQKLHSNMQSFRANTKYGAAYTAALSQLVFSTIAQAASDSSAVFGEEPAYSSELVTWAVKQTEALALLLKRHVLASSAAAGGLRVAAECIQICLGHCSLLEARGLTLSPVLLRFFRSIVEQALSANLKRIELNSAALAAADDWFLTYSPAGHPLSSASSLGSVMSAVPKLSSSANRFNSMVQEFFEDVGMLETLDLDLSAMEGIQQEFNSYVNLLISALPSSADTEDNLEGSGSRIVKMAENEAQQIALLANASLLADELLPRAAMKLFSASNMVDEPGRRASSRQSRLPEHREWKKRLQRLVDRLRDSFCRQHALDLIFSEDGEANLNPHIYIAMDQETEEPEWFPSLIFQELFGKLSRMASLASDMFVGRERFATILLMRLIETVILWLSDDQAFWQEIEEGPTPLGPFGLQQLYLDMEFVLLFSSQGRYLSRNLHQTIKNIIARAIESVSATGVDPYSTLPEDEWFAEVAQIAIKTLMGKATFEDMDHVTSPTASISGKSVSSVGDMM